MNISRIVHLTQQSTRSTIPPMRVLIAAIASLVGSVAFQMSVDAGYIRHFTWAVPWLWGGCAALWTAWIITHDRIVKQWLKGLHERLGRGIHPIRVVICLAVFLAVSLGLQVLMKPQAQAAASTETAKPVQRSADESKVPVPTTNLLPQSSTPKHKHRVINPTTPSVSTSAENSPAVASITQAPGSAISINQQGGITAGTINYAAPDRRLTDDQKVSLENCLKTNPGTFSVTAVSGIAKAYKYAMDWSEVFSAAKWTNENPIPVMSFIIGQGDWSGLRFGISGGWDDIKKQASIKDGSPEMEAYKCISKTNNIIGGGLFTPYPDMPTGRVRISVGDY